MDSQPILTANRRGRPMASVAHLPDVLENVRSNTARRKLIFYQDKFRLFAIHLAADVEAAPEARASALWLQFFYVVRGGGWIRAGRTSFAVTEGDSVIIPQGVKHSVATGNSGLDFLVICARQ